MDFVSIRVHCSTDLIEVLISQLFELGFDSFQEFEDGFTASCDAMAFAQAEVEALIAPFKGVEFFIQEEDKINWNEEWEKNYDPITVADKCIVRASFHKPEPTFEYEIIVTPKMSFGTGHHATTYQMLEYQMSLDHQNKKVLDVGTGTGILAIMAAKRGAASILGTDIDTWCIENSEENLALNNVSNAQLILGEIEKVKDRNFDIIIANINKNVLLAQLGAYSERLADNGNLMLSGFYRTDSADLEKEAAKFGLKSIAASEKNKWAMLVFSKE